MRALLLCASGLAVIFALHDGARLSEVLLGVAAGYALGAAQMARALP